MSTDDIGGGTTVNFTLENSFLSGNGAVSSLSKRTAVYAVAIGQKSSGVGLGINPSTGQTENLAQIPNIVNSDTDKQLAVIVGVRHNF
ncbi:hypothetical protein [Paraburkholderia sp. RL17-337-BIB-A]|uniref:hypothetical protein n=1 Tax=Paraburkholderia sp. RL17-337-BIB-A TaxID=3031636 RepID=UPI0038BB9482